MTKFQTDFGGRVIQVVEALDVGDAVSNQVIALDKMMRDMGLASSIIVKFMHHDVSDKCRTVDQVVLRDDDVIIFHAVGYSEHTLEYALNANCTRIILYHNITPHDFFDEGTFLHDFCKKGRDQLASVIDRFHFFWADSQFNLDELIALGAPRKRSFVIPIVVSEPECSAAVKTEPGSWLFLGRVAANKGQVELVKAFAEVHKDNPKAANKLYLVGGFAENDPYYRDLQSLVAAEKLDQRVVITGKVSEEQKESFLRKAAIFVSFSKHEGFGVPLIEAPLRGTPVVALRGTAVHETMGDGQCVVDKAEDIAPCVSRLLSDSDFAQLVLAEQRSNAKRFAASAVRERLRKALCSVLPKPGQYQTISIVICTLNRRADLARCLDYLAYQSNPSFEVVVVDGPSDDGTKKLLTEWEGRIKVVHNPHKNLSISRNLGADAAAGDIIAYIDDDAIPFADWTDTLLHEFNRRPLTTAGLGGPAYYAGSLKFQIEDIAFNCFAETISNVDSTKIGSDGWFRSLLGTNTAFSRSHIVSVSGFDEQYDYYLDESDLTYRMQAAGHVVAYCPQLFLRHEFARSDNRKSRFSFNWFSICKNTAYFIALYSGLTGDRLRNYLKGRIEKERVAPLEAAVADEQISSTRCSQMVDEIWRGVEQGLSDSERGPLTRKISKKYPPFLPFETKKDFLRVGREIPRLHICIVSKEFPPFGASGGIGTLYYHLASELLLLGHEVSVVMPAKSAKRYDQGRFHIRYVERGPVDFGADPPAIADNLSWSLRAAAAVAEIHTELPVDVVETALWDTEGLAVALIEQPRPPVVVRLVTPFPVAAETNGWSISPQVVAQFVAAEKALIASADAIVAISESILRTASSRLDVTPDPRWTVNHCGIAYWPLFDWAADYDDLTSERSIGEFIEEFPTTVLFIGRLERRKGVDTLLQAAKQFLRKRRDVGLIICGKDVEGWETEAKKLLPTAIISKMLFTGSVSDATREKLISRAYCLIFPSRYESFGLVPLEAFVHGVPVVAAAAGAIPEVVADGKSGLLFPPQDSNALAEKVKQLLSDKAIREDLSGGARKAIHHFSSRNSALRSVDLYTSLLESKLERYRVVN